MEGRFEDSKRVFEELHCVFLDREQKQYRDDWNFDPTGDQEVMNLDEEKMEKHILNCLGALAVKQQLRVAKGIQLKLTAYGDALTAEQQAARNKVFKAAVSSVGDGLTHDGAAEPLHNTAVRQLSVMFPEDRYSIPCRMSVRESHGWLPLKWAAVVAADSQLGATAADVETVYSINPQELHLFAENGPVEALEHLLDVCPEVPAATMSTESKENLLHCVARVAMEDQVAKVRLLCARYPAMKVGRDNQGKTALHVAASISLRHGGGGGLVQALCETDGHLVASTPVVHPTDAEYPRNGWLPLHMFIDEFQHPPQRADQGLVPWEDALRTLLRVYPDAAGDVVGTMREFSPLGVKFMKLPPPFRRLVLDAARRLDAGGDGRNAAPRHGTALLQDLTWKARENAAVSVAAVWWASLREAEEEEQGAAAGHGGAKAAVLMNKDLVKNIMSYV